MTDSLAETLGETVGPITLLESFLKSTGWTIRHKELRPARPASTCPVDELPVGPLCQRALKRLPDGIFLHQREAIGCYLAGDDIAITTPTASGKTLVFHACALEELSRNPKARVLALYPLKALATEQAERWSSLLHAVAPEIKVGRIDGSVAVRDRARILHESRVVVMTPDVLHAWALSSTGTKPVLDFIRNLALVVIDEAHNYTGVFGSNSAFLFRRLRHISAKLGGKLRFIAASATMVDPLSHLSQLTGTSFRAIGPDLDSSPRSDLEILLCVPPGKDILAAVSDVLAYAAQETGHQSITFVDSRKQTEYLASILDRRLDDPQEDADDVDYEKLEHLRIYPYRAGYEENDRRRIQSMLASGQLKGVVSTSALEMGVDLPHLSLGILVGVPRSATSFYQRIGRIARRNAGVVLVINDGSVQSETIFRHPEQLMHLPLARGALYLHNRRIQYIHAMCLAGPNGEDASLANDAEASTEDFQSPIELPDDFLQLCQAERIGDIDAELQAMKAQGDDPHYTFPLRDLESQFKVEFRRGPEASNLGSLSHSQLMREAYPGAVYYYQTKPYRVWRVKKHARTVEVRREKRYFTSPVLLPPLILPNLTNDRVFDRLNYGPLQVVECGLQIGEAVVGFKEKRGSTAMQLQYPLDPALGIYHDSERFQRYIFTSGVILTHPALNKDNVNCDALSKIVNEAFLMSLPFERQDVNAGADKHRRSRDGFEEGQRFLCLYDQTYGSLRLTSHLLKDGTLQDSLDRALEVARNDAHFLLNAETLGVLEEIAACLVLPQNRTRSGAGAPTESSEFVAVIMPGSSGVNIEKDNEEFFVEGVFFSPIFGGVAYRGKHLSEKRKAERETWRHSAATATVPIQRVVPLHGESVMGWFNIETGELVQELPVHGEF